VSDYRPPDPLFSTGVIDPNWGYDNFGLKKHGAAKSWYRGSDVEELAKIPVRDWFKRDANVFVWGTGPKVMECMEVLKAWGLHVVTRILWVKTVPHQGDIKQGVGFWGYSVAEDLWVCRFGTAKAPKYRSTKDKPYMLLCGPRENPCFYDKELHAWLSDPTITELPSTIFYSKLGPHSRKPLSLFEWVEAYFPGRYLELFARGTRPGWTCVGHETGWHMHEGGVMRVEEAERLGLVEKIQPEDRP
jgi:N6-adenosine-specific RNA methylase IME4